MGTTLNKLPSGGDKGNSGARRRRPSSKTKSTSDPRPAPRQAITVRDVAEEAGFSITTVSFVLNGHAKLRGIADSTVRRVEQAARELNYSPNMLARGLRRQKSGAIGLVVPHFRNDWAERVLQGMYPLLDKRQMVPLVVSHRGNPRQESVELESLLQRQVEGIIANPLPDGAERYRAVLNRGVPLVFIGDTLDELPEVSFAAWDPSSVRLAVQHLIDEGCRDIAYFAFEDERQLVRRCFEVFASTLKQADVPLPRSRIVLMPRGESFSGSVDRLFGSNRPRPDGIFALYNDTARATVDDLFRLGLRVPDDVRVATWGDSPMVGPRAYALTTVHAPVREEGEEAMAALLKLIKDPDSGPFHTLVPGEQLITNQRSAPPTPPTPRPDADPTVNLPNR